MKLSVRWITPLLMVCCVRPVQAEEFCVGVKMGLAASENQFRSLRGPFNSISSNYKANITFGQAGKCTIRGGDRVATLRCIEELPYEALRARSTYRRYITFLESCLGSDLERDGREISGATFLSKTYVYNPTGDKIAVSLYDFSSEGVFEVSILITNVDPG